MIVAVRRRSIFRGFGVRRPLNAPIKYAALFYRSIAPGERYCRKCGNIDASLILSPPF
ncbi:MAG: hypothetical protein IJZ19_11875 [Lentisphaeria bacterium]|nr:hypothetical protein [Lentisphaeria bacterium]